MWVGGTSENITRDLYEIGPVTRRAGWYLDNRAYGGGGRDWIITQYNSNKGEY